MNDVPQNFENHRITAPLYYRVLPSIFAVNILWSLWRVISAVLEGSGWYATVDSLVALGLAIGLVIVWAYLRAWPLRLQDRLIRLEMRLRLQQVLPDDLKSRIPELSLGRLIALRFASDEELPDLCRRALTETFRDREEIKHLVRHWQPDHLRI